MLCCIKTLGVSEPLFSIFGIHHFLSSFWEVKLHFLELSELLPDHWRVGGQKFSWKKMCKLLPCSHFHFVFINVVVLLVRKCSSTILQNSTHLFFQSMNRTSFECISTLKPTFESTRLRRDKCFQWSIILKYQNLPSTHRHSGLRLAYTRTNTQAKNV